MHDLRTLLLVMRSIDRVWRFPVQIFVNEPGSVSKVVVDIVRIHVIIVDEHSAILMLRFEIETNIIPVSWPNIIVRVSCMPEVSREWERQGP